MTHDRKSLLVRNSGLKIALMFLCLLTLAVFSAGSAAAQENDNSGEAIALFNDAQDAHAKGDLKKAVELYTAAIKIFPEFPEAEYQRAGAFRSLGDLAGAEKGFRRALEIREDWTLALAALGSLLVETKNYTEAEKILAHSIELDPQNFPAYAAIADVKIKTGSSPEVLKDLLKRVSVLASKANPPTSIWIAKAQLEQALGMFREAVESSTKVLELDPNDRSAKYLRAELALRSGDTIQALKFADELALSELDGVDQKMLHVNILIAEGRSDDALKILDTIKDAPPPVVELRERLILQTSSNIAEIEKLTGPDSKDASALGRLCVLYRKKDPAKALDYCRRASELEPQNFAHAVGFGAALVTAKRYAEAVVILRKLLDFEPDNFTARANLATALFQLNNFAEAKIEFQKLIDEQPKLAPAYYFLGICFDRLTEYMDAMANYQSFLRLADPKVSQLEIDKVNLRLPILQRQIKNKEGKRK